MTIPPAKEPRKLEKVTGTLPVRDTVQTRLNALLKEAVPHLKNKNHPTLDPLLARAAALAPDDPRVLHFQGLSAFEKRDAKTAFDFLRRALEKRPNDAALQHNMAAVLISLGNFDKAEELLRSAVRIKPDYAEAFHTLSPIFKFKADDPLIPMMEQGLQRPDLTDIDTSFYAFALAKACDDADLPDKAWPALVRGNDAMPHTFDPALETEGVDALLQNATRDRLTEMGRYGHPSAAPILVVGLPRSGTTLLESMIANHPQVHAAGELTVLGGIARQVGQKLKIPRSLIGYGATIEKITPPHAYAAGLGYLNGARATTTRWFDHFVDKLPDNSFNLGLASILVPNARVIHIMRHPLDVMLSIYFQRFTSVKYSFQPRDILHHYHNYKRTMDHWRNHLPMDIVELRYESLVQDPDFAQQWLWSRLGLSAEVDHVPTSAHSGEQRTASRFQVRQPVYQDSREKFRRYETHMGEFIKGLGGMDAIEAEVDAQRSRCALRAATG